MFFRLSGVYIKYAAILHKNREKKNTGTIVELKIPSFISRRRFLISARLRVIPEKHLKNVYAITELTS